MMLSSVSACGVSLRCTLPMSARAGSPTCSEISLTSARDKALTEVTAREIARRAPPSDVIAVLGPAEAPIAVVRGRHRWRLLIKAPRDADLQGYLRAWAGTIPKLKSDIRITVDIDPYNFL